MAFKKLFDELVLDGKYFNVHQDWEVPVPGFFILASKRKIHSVGEFTDEEAIEFISMLVKLRKAMKKVLGIDYVALLQREDNLDYNFHLCIFPKYPWIIKKYGSSMNPVQVWKEAKENTDKKTMDEVKLAARKVREYLKN